MVVHPLRLSHRLSDGLVECDTGGDAEEVPLAGGLHLLVPEHLHHLTLARGGARLRRDSALLLQEMINDSMRSEETKETLRGHSPHLISPSCDSTANNQSIFRIRQRFQHKTRTKPKTTYHATLNLRSTIPHTRSREIEDSTCAVDLVCVPRARLSKVGVASHWPMTSPASL